MTDFLSLSFSLQMKLSRTAVSEDEDREIGRKNHAEMNLRPDEKKRKTYNSCGIAICYE